MAKQINTRIQLKYDSYANWKSSNIALLSGEIAVVELPTSDTTNNIEQATKPAILFKVGPGNFNDLPWASALAADVYSWAKEASLVVNASGTGNVVAGIEWDATANGGKGGLKYTTASVATSEGLQNVQTAINTINQTLASYGDIVTHNVAEFATAAQGEKADSAVQTIVSGNANGTIAVDGVDVAVKGLGSAAYTDSADYATSEENGAKAAIDAYTIAHANDYTNTQIDGAIKAVEDKLPSSADYGVLSVTGESAIKATTTSQNAKVSLALDNGGNVVLSQSATGLKATIDLSAYRLIADDANTTYGLEYDSTNKAIKLVEGGTDLSIDASEFVADGMLESVTVDASANTLTFKWNTTAGINETTVKLTDIADIYTAATNAAEVQVAISNTNEISATLVNGGISTAKLADNVVNEAKIADEAVTATKIKNGVITNEHIASNAGIDATKISGLATVATSGNYADLSNLPLLGSLAAKSTIGTTDITDKVVTKAKLAEDVQTSLGLADNAKQKQTAYSASGSTSKTITKVEQNANGEVTVTYGEIAFPEVEIPVGSGAVTTASVADGVVTINGGVKLNDHTLEDDTSKADITLAKVATTGSTDDLDGGTEVWVFYCGNASTDVLEPTLVANEAGGTTATI